MFLHLRIDAVHLKIILCGYAFGTVAAQMLYGASPNTFPLRRQVSAMVLLAPHSPPHCHQEYSTHLPWQSYLLTGPPSRFIPFNLLARLARWVLARQVKSEAMAERFLRRLLFSKMSEEEREQYRRWRETRGITEGQLEKEMAANTMRSIHQTWQGFLDIPTVYHSGWGGVIPSGVDKDYESGTLPPVYVVAASRDHTVPVSTAEWVSRAYKNSELRLVDGSHLSLLFYLDELWKEVLH